MTKRLILGGALLLALASCGKNSSDYKELKAQYDTEGRRLDVLIKADLESYKELLKGADQNV